MKRKNKYDLHQKAPLQKEGIEGFKSEKDKKWYFHFHNKEGETLLYSQAYATMKSRDNGIKSVMKNLDKQGQYSIISTKSNKHYYTLRAGNNQEIGRSKDYRTLNELKNELNLLQEIAFENKLRKDEKMEELEIEQYPPLQSNPWKHAFRLDVYMDPEGGANALKVEHVLTGKKKPFAKLDFKKLERFVREHLETTVLSTKGFVKKATSSKESIKKQKEPSTILKAKDVFVSSGDSKNRVELLDKNDPFKVKITLEKSNALVPETPYFVWLEAYSLGTGNEVQLKSFTEYHKTELQAIEIPVQPNTLDSGLYIIKGKLEQEQKTITGDCLLKVL
jgi:uncharacterized protein YegP (UPF0339 family)